MLPIDAVQGLTLEGSKDVAVKLGIHDSKVEDVANTLLNLYELFVSKDASMVEINPFAEDNSGNFVCLDAKLKFDDNAEFRQKSSVRPARLEPGRRQRSGSSRVQSQLHRPGWRYRLYGERGWPGHGHHGHHQTPRW